MKNLEILALLLMITAAPVVYAQTGNHFGEQKFLSYSIEYLTPLGITIVNETGIAFLPYEYPPSYSDEILPEEYFGEYALYFTGGTMSFRVIIKNEGRRTYRNLKIEIFQEWLDIDGGAGEPMGDDNKQDWFVEKLGPEEEIVLEGEFAIPLIGESGIDQTHLRILHWSPKHKEEKLGEQFNKGQIILEDFQAGLWCPGKL